MGVLERSSKEKVIVSSLVTAFFVALVSSVLLLILRANQLSNEPSVSAATAGLGPLDLFVIDKTPLEGGGFQASIGPKPGLALYFALWLAAGGLAAYLRLKPKGKTE